MEVAAYGVGPALDSARTWARANPVVVETSFVRPGGAAPSDGAPAFDAVFRDARVIAGTPADSARLRAYAVRLRDLSAAHDTAAVFDAFRHSLTDAFVAAGGARAVVEDSASFMESTRARIVMDDVVPFEADEVGLRSWAGGRVWELYRAESKDPLLVTPWAGAGRLARAVFVGERADGELRVVR